jgi:AbiV family abortive infection protein
MPKKRVISQYAGRLTPAQAARGIEAAIKNARSLHSDALLLLQNHRWARAAALAILAIEESGKPNVIRSMLLARNQEELRGEWRNYRNHCMKNVMWILPNLVNKGARHLEELRPIFDKDGEHGPLLDALKQISFYSDAYGNCNWSLPETGISQELAGSLVQIAEVLSSKNLGSMTSEAELQLWVKHLGPVWKGSMAHMKAALLACYADANTLNVLRGDISPNDMVKFIV